MSLVFLYANRSQKAYLIQRLAVIIPTSIHHHHLPTATFASCLRLLSYEFVHDFVHVILQNCAADEPEWSSCWLSLSRWAAQSYSALTERDLYRPDQTRLPVHTRHQVPLTKHPQSSAGRCSEGGPAVFTSDTKKIVNCFQIAFNFQRYFSVPSVVLVAL